MTKTAHTEGPLTMDGFGNIRAEGHPSLIAFGGVALGNRSDPEVKANDDRLFALWNACVGIPNPEVVGEAIGALRAMLALVNRMDVASWLACEHPVEFCNASDIVGDAQAILAKLEGRS